MPSVPAGNDNFAGYTRPDHVRVMVQLRSTPAMAAAAFGPVASAPATALSDLPGVLFDTSYSPVPIPPRAHAARAGERALSFAAAFSAPGESTYVMRAAVHQEHLPSFMEHIKNDPHVVGIFADPKIQAIDASGAICPSGPVGSDRDVARLLLIDQLSRRGMDGTGVKVAIVDTGINRGFLASHGKTPQFSPELSWGPMSGQPLGNMPVSHGTMCAYDICIAAPHCTLVDLAVLTSNTQGGSTMDGLLSDAVQAYAVLLSYMARGAEPFQGDDTPRTLVVNNSWGMFHPSWDFPKGDPRNYSHNPDHPFNMIVASLEAAGADILFAAGNCGTECPDQRCQGKTDGGVYGANSSRAVLSVAGVSIAKQRLGYSSKGPGCLEDKKPDVACFTHFAGSGVFAADGGTSAATPVAAGLVAAIRRIYPSSVLPPADLRDLVRQTAEQPAGGASFNYELGAGVINVAALLAALDSRFPPHAPPGPPGPNNGGGGGSDSGTAPADAPAAAPNDVPGTVPAHAPESVPSAESPEAAFDRFDAAFGRGTARAAAGIDACAMWNQGRGHIQGIITALRAVSFIFPLAQRAAVVVQTLADILDRLCKSGPS
jgi:subtilisin family serine protease